MPDPQSFDISGFPPRLRLVKNGEIEAPRADPYAGLEEAARRAAVEADTQRDLRVKRWQRRVAWFAILTAYATIIYFAWQLGRGAL